MNLNTLIEAFIIVLPVYVWFFYLWISNFKKVWKTSKFWAVSPILVILYTIFNVWLLWGK